METTPWPQVLIDAHPAIFGKTEGLGGVPEWWRGLLLRWADEVAEAGAVEAGVYAERAYEKYNTLRVDLIAPGGPQEKWDALEVLLEDRSENIDGATANDEQK